MQDNGVSKEAIIKSPNNQNRGGVSVNRVAHQFDDIYPNLLPGLLLCCRNLQSQGRRVLGQHRSRRRPLKGPCLSRISIGMSTLLRRAYDGSLGTLFLLSRSATD
jgi:hypothetical protein